MTLPAAPPTAEGVDHVIAAPEDGKADPVGKGGSWWSTTTAHAAAEPGDRAPIPSGYDVRTAHDGLQGVELAEQFRPQVVLLDIGLPKLNGYAVARRISGLSRGARRWCSSPRPDGDRTTTAAGPSKAGFDHHMVKPVDPGAAKLLVSTQSSLT